MQKCISDNLKKNDVQCARACADACTWKLLHFLCESYEFYVVLWPIFK